MSCRRQSRPGLYRRLAGVPTLRAPTDGEERAISRWLLPRWTQLEYSSSQSAEERLLLIDDQLLGYSSTHRRPQWLLGAGTWLDLASLHHHPPHIQRHALDLLGPTSRALWATRDGLRGYRTTLYLLHLSRWTPALNAAAYVQQVQYGHLAPDGLLAAHLRFGARVLAVTDNSVELEWTV